jgi:hypothetical protein
MPRSHPNPRRGGRVAGLPPELPQVNRNAAGIDIGTESHYVAVPAGRDPEGRAVRQATYDERSFPPCPPPLSSP